MSKKSKHIKQLEKMIKLNVAIYKKKNNDKDAEIERLRCEIERFQKACCAKDDFINKIQAALDENKATLGIILMKM